MANKRSSISAGLRADATDWKRGVNEAIQATHRMKREVEATRIRGPQMDSSGTIQKISGGFTELKSKVDLVRDGVNALKGAIQGPVEANVWYADLKDRLTAVTGNAEDAASMMQQLRLISDEQSLTDDQLQKLVDYSERMISLGLTTEEAADYMRELANAAEWSGRGVEDFDGLVSALDKVRESGDASLKSIIALSKETPAIRNALRAAFGSNTAEDLEKLKLSADQLIQGVLRGLKTLETSRPSNDEIALAFEKRSKQWTGADAKDNNGTLPERNARSADDLKKETQQNAELRKAADLRQKEIKDRETIAQRTRDLRDELSAGYQMEIAIAENNVEKIKALEDEKDLRDAIAEIQKDGVKMTADEVGAVRLLIEARRADKAAVDQRKASTEIGKSEEDRKIQSLRHMGQNSRANRLEDRKKIRELQDQGMTRDQAKFQVERDRDMQEDETLGPGKRRIRLIKKPPAPEVPAESKVEGKAPSGAKGKAAKEAGGADINSGGAVAQLGELNKKMDRLITISTPTAADRQRPVNRSA